MTWFLIISLGIGILYVAIIFLFLVGWLRTPSFKISDKPTDIKISVLVPVRNEEKNIEGLLNDLLKQTYPQNMFEVLVINDHSTDSTAEILERYHKKHSNFRIITLREPSLTGKKSAIEEGIKNSRFGHIVITDGDCRAGVNWLQAIAQYYEKYSPVMILGPVIFKGKKKFWQGLLHLEQFSLLGTIAGSCGVHIPVMSNGANLSFEKKLFFEFANPLFNKTPSGDDVFLLLNAKKKYPKRIGFLKSVDAVIETNPPADLESFWEQRKRWVSKSRYYSDPGILLTGGIVFLTSFMLFIFFIGSFFSILVLKAFLILFFLKSIVDLLFLLTLTSFFEKKSLLRYFLPAQILYFAYVTLTGFSGFFGQYYWKGRKWEKGKRKL